LTHGFTGERIGKLRRDFGDRREHEPPVRKARMRNRQPRFMDHSIAIKKDVDVERARPF
jgi:hypothetical protein